MTNKKIPTIATPTQVTIKLPASDQIAVLGHRRYVQLAYAFGDSEKAAEAEVSFPVLILGDAVGVPALPLDNPLSTASGGPKIPPGRNLLPPDKAASPPLPVKVPTLLGTIEVPKSEYLIDVLIQVRKR